MSDSTKVHGSVRVGKALCGAPIGQGDYSLYAKEVTCPTCIHILQRDFPDNNSPSALGTKPSNPKQAFAAQKVPLFSVNTAPFLAEMSLGMLEGALKYGRHNYRESGVLVSTYLDAAARHLLDYWEGIDMDPDSPVPIHNLAKAACCLQIAFDGIMMGNLTDDRPISTHAKEWLKSTNARANQLREAFKGRAAEPFTARRAASKGDE